ncbi:MAG: hypothetical protein ACOCP4_04065, partial [Candidatus Woesearchaeota archaeon]
TKALHIMELIYDRKNDKFKFSSLSADKKVKKKPISLLLSSNEDFRAINNVFTDAEGKLDHINTIVFNEFDQLYHQWQNDNNLDKFDNILFNDYFLKLNKSFQDIYLINNNYNIDIENWFNYSSKFKNKINRYFWLLGPEERIELEGWNDKISHKVRFYNIAYRDYVSKVNGIENIIKKLNVLGEFNYCNGEIIKIGRLLFDLRDKFNTFYDPTELRERIKNLIEDLKLLKEKWFPSKLDDGIIQSILNFLEDFIDNENHNFKLKYFFDKIYRANTDSTFVIITKHSCSESDKNYLIKTIQKKSPEANFKFLNIKQNIPEILKYNDLFNYCLLFTFRGKYQVSPLTNIYAKENVYLLNPLEFNYANYKYVNKTKPTLDTLYDNKKRIELLNLDMTYNKEIANPNPEFINTFSEESWIESSDNKDTDKQDFDFEFFVKSIQNKIQSEGLSSTNEQDEVMVLFEDGSYEIYTSNKTLFVHNDSIKSIENAKKEAKNMEKGDTIFHVKNKGSVKETMLSILKTKDAFEGKVFYNEEWRYLLNEKLKSLDNSLENLNNLLERNGFLVSINVPLDWINGNTTQPNDFEKLLVALVKMNVIDENKIPSYLDAVKSIKSLQITFLRETIKKIIAEFDNLPYTSKNKLIDENLINEFLEYIDIKRVSIVIKL